MLNVRSVYGRRKLYGYLRRLFLCNVRSATGGSHEFNTGNNTQRYRTTREHNHCGWSQLHSPRIMIPVICLLRGGSSCAFAGTAGWLSCEFDAHNGISQTVEYGTAY